MRSRKIIWAVDPFTRSLKLQQAAASVIRSIQEGFRRYPMVQPVYFSEWRSQDEATQRFKKIVRKLSAHHLLPLRVVSTYTRSIRHVVDALLAYVDREKGDLIVVSSRTRKGLSRILQGSFAETLLLHSATPVVVVNSKWKHRRAGLRRILFPTDFSDASYLAFLEVLPLVQRWEAQLEIFHKVTYELHDIALHASSPNLGHVYTIAYERYLESLHAKAEAWQLEAKHYGISSSAEFDYRARGNIADSILKRARRSADMIAMAATSGRGKTILLGSVTRRVVRASACPVWIQRQPAQRVSKKRAA